MFSTPPRRIAGWVVLLVCAASLVLGVIYMVVRANQTLDAVRDTQLEGTPLGQQLASSADRILDCTDSAGDCYRRNQARTAELVSGLNDYQFKVVVAGAACSAGIQGEGLTVRQREVRIQSCVLRRLARDAKP